MQISRITLCITLCAPLFLPIAARAEGPPATVTTVPVQSGVAAEARTIIEAPPERVAAVAGDPAAFAELLPAAVVRLKGRDGDAQIVEVERHEAWPIGVVRWVESVRKHQEPGGTIVIERQAIDNGYFRRLQATWWIAPLPGGRSAVTYRVSMDLRRWAPAWMVRRGNSTGILGTLSRLRRMSESGRAAAPGPLRPLAAAPATP